MKKRLPLSLSDVVSIMLINVGILTFMSRINFMLSRVEHERSFITSGPGSIWQIGKRTWLYFLNSPVNKKFSFSHLSKLLKIGKT